VRVLPPLVVVDTGRRIGRARGSEPQHPFRTWLHPLGNRSQGREQLRARPARQVTSCRALARAPAASTHSSRTPTTHGAAATHERKAGARAAAGRAASLPRTRPRMPPARNIDIKPLIDSGACGFVLARVALGVARLTRSAASTRCLVAPVAWFARAHRADPCCIPSWRTSCIARTRCRPSGTSRSEGGRAYTPRRGPAGIGDRALLRADCATSHGTKRLPPSSAYPQPRSPQGG
jgi:hypothetical protein